MELAGIENLDSSSNGIDRATGQKIARGVRGCRSTIAIADLHCSRRQRAGSVGDSTPKPVVETEEEQ